MASGPIQTNFNPNNPAEVAKFKDKIKSILKSKVPKSRLTYSEGFAEHLVTETKGKKMFMTEQEIYEQFNDYVKEISTFVPPDLPVPPTGPKKDEGRHDIPGAEPEPEPEPKTEPKTEPEPEPSSAPTEEAEGSAPTEDPPTEDDEEVDEEDIDESKGDDSMADAKLTPTEIKNKFGIDVTADMTIDELVEGIKNKTIVISGGLSRLKIEPELKLYNLYMDMVKAMKGQKISIYGTDEVVTDELLTTFTDHNYVIYFDETKLKSLMQSVIESNRPDPTIDEDPDEDKGKGGKKGPDSSTPGDSDSGSGGKKGPDKDDKEVEMEQKDGEFPEEFYENVLRELGLIKLDGISVSKKDGYKPKKGETQKSVKIVKEPDKKNTRVECNDVTCALGLFEKMLKDIQENGEKSEFYKKRILFNGQYIPMAEFASRGEDGLKDLREMVTYIEKNPGKDYEVPERKDDGKPVDEKNATKKTDQVLDELKGLDSKTRDVVKRVKGKEVKDVSEKVLKELESKEGKEKFKENYEELVRFEALRNRLERIAREVKELEKHPELLGTLLASKKQELIEALNEFNKEFSREKLEELYKFKAQLIFVGRAEPARYRGLVPKLGITPDEAERYQEFSKASKDLIDGIRLSALLRNFGHDTAGILPGETGKSFRELRKHNAEVLLEARHGIARGNNPATHICDTEKKIEKSDLLSVIERGRIEEFNNKHIRSRRVFRGKTYVVAPKYDADMVTAAVKLEQELDREIAGAKNPRKGLDI